MNQEEIKQILWKMPSEEVVENLTYLIHEMEDKEQLEFLGLNQEPPEDVNKISGDNCSMNSGGEDYERTVEDEIQAAQSSGFHYPEGICCGCAMEEDKCECQRHGPKEITSPTTGDTTSDQAAELLQQAIMKQTKESQK